MRRTLPAAALLAATLLAAGPVRAEDDAPPPRPGPAQTAATYAATYGALYTTAIVFVNTTFAVINATVPAAWTGTVATFGVPAVMMSVMSVAVPYLQTNVPPTVAGWFADPAAAEPE